MQSIKTGVSSVLYTCHWSFTWGDSDANLSVSCSASRFFFLWPCDVKKLCPPIVVSRISPVEIYRMWITLIFLLFGILSVCYTKQPVTASRVTYLWCKEEETAEVVNSSFFVSVQHFVPRLVEFCELNEVVSLVMHSVTALSALCCYRSALAPAANVGLSWRRGLNVPPASLIGWCRTLHESSTQAAVVTRCDHPSGPRIGDPNASCGVAAHSNHTHTHTHTRMPHWHWMTTSHSLDSHLSASVLIGLVP